MTAKQLHTSILSLALLSGIAGAHAAPSKSPSAQKPAPTKRASATGKTRTTGEKVDALTGSHVKQSYRRQGQITDGPNQVVVYDRAMLERSGASSLGDFLRQRNVGH